MLERWLVFLFFLCSCTSAKPIAVPKKRLRPSYNYMLMHNIKQGSDSDDGYYSTGPHFKEAYLKTMTETNNASGKNAHDAYVEQKSRNQSSDIRPRVAKKPISNAQSDEELIMTASESILVPTMQDVVDI